MLIRKDMFVELDGEIITLEEAAYRLGVPIPEPVIENCYALDDYLSLPLVEPPYIISDGILPRQSKALLFGAPKIGKSLLAGQMGLCVSSGEKFLGYSTNIGSVIYGQCEISSKNLQDRLSKQKVGIPNYVDGMFVETIHKLRLPSDKDGIKARLDKIHPDLLILDPLLYFFEGDLVQDVQKVQEFNRMIDEFIDEFGVSVVIIHHSRKQGEELKGIEEALGSIAITAFYDSLIWVHSEVTGRIKNVRVEMSLRNAESPQPFIIRLDEKTLLFRK